jgi:hypothetical protein
LVREKFGWKDWTAMLNGKMLEPGDKPPSSGQTIFVSERTRGGGRTKPEDLEWDERSVTMTEGAG